MPVDYSEVDVINCNVYIIIRVRFQLKLVQHDKIQLIYDISYINRIFVLHPKILGKQKSVSISIYIKKIKSAAYNALLYMKILFQLSLLRCLNKILEVRFMLYLTKKATMLWQNIAIFGMCPESDTSS